MSNNYYYNDSISNFFVNILPRIDAFINSNSNTHVNLFFEDNLVDLLIYKYGNVNKHVSFNNIHKIDKNNTMAIYDLFIEKIEHNKFKLIPKQLEKNILEKNIGTFQSYYLIAINDKNKNVNIAELLNKINTSDLYFISINNKYVANPTYKILNKFVELISYFNKCAMLITNDYDMKDYALNCGCKEIIFISENVKEYTYKYNPFKSKICILNNITLLHNKANINFNNTISFDNINLINIKKLDKMGISNSTNYIINGLDRITIINKDLSFATKTITTNQINNLASLSMNACNDKNIFVNIVKKMITLGNIFNELSINPDKSYHIILVGNIKLCSNFENRLLYTLNNGLPNTFDICFLTNISTYSQTTKYNNDLIKIYDFDIMDSLFIINHKIINKLKFTITDFSETANTRIQLHRLLHPHHGCRLQYSLSHWLRRDAFRQHLHNRTDDGRLHGTSDLRRPCICGSRFVTCAFAR